MTIAGLPVESWLLMAAAVGIGLAVELAFWRAHHRPRARRTERDADRT